MRTEVQGYTTPINQTFLPFHIGMTEQSNVDRESIHMLAEGNESLATSQEAARLQQALMNLTQDLYFVWWAEDWAPASRVSEQFPVLLDVSVFSQEDVLAVKKSSDDRDRLLFTLRSSFDVKPVEDGMDHPAEEIISRALKLPVDERVFDWLKSFSLDATHPDFAASILRCLGRFNSPGTVFWRVDLIQSALAMGDAQIRDAAVQAAECWGGEDIRNVLKAHREPLPWIQDYIDDVIEDLGE